MRRSGSSSPLGGASRRRGRRLDRSSARERARTRSVARSGALATPGTRGDLGALRPAGRRRRSAVDLDQPSRRASRVLPRRERARSAAGSGRGRRVRQRSGPLARLRDRAPTSSSPAALSPSAIGGSRPPDGRDAWRDVRGDGGRRADGLLPRRGASRPLARSVGDHRAVRAVEASAIWSAIRFSMIRSRAAALRPPMTTAISERPSRWTEVRRLNPDALV